MKILSVYSQNFASYKQLNFDFTNQGLTLIAGATGSGKSTLCDLIPWTLFGKTAKGGAVDEILSWPGDEATSSQLGLSTGEVIVRIRSKNNKYNDLYYRTRDANIIRGKDLNDTQKLINSLLETDYDLYLAGAYFHEFSQTAQFFTTTAKNRRTICEQLVDLSLAKKLQLKLSEESSTKAKELASIKSALSTINSNIELLKRLETVEVTKARAWNTEQKRLKEQAIAAYDRFEANRKKTITNQCKSCGTVLKEPKEVVNTDENPYLSRLADLEQAVNPHQGGVKDFSQEIAAKLIDCNNLRTNEDQLALEINDLEMLKLVVNDYRSVSITNTISSIEQQTNQLFTDYFDSEIKVSFEVADADKLEVNIYKDGNECSYTQLSKGQRCLLKLCFGISVMKSVANHHRLSFSQIFFDEALDGLDEHMKTKAYRLLEMLSLSYESVFVVEHSETLKNLFNNKYSVELINGSSEISGA